jgi:uncharacterized protein YacL
MRRVYRHHRLQFKRVAEPSGVSVLNVSDLANARRQEVSVLDGEETRDA